VLGALLAVPLSAEAAPRDRDHDGLSDRYEVKRSHTNPRKADTDGDTLRDGFEVRQVHANPRKKDTDGDGLTDGYEVKQSKTSALRDDTDRDGTADGVELLIGTNPRERGKKKDILPPPPPPPPTPDLLPPETQINAGPSGTATSGGASFTFSSSETGSTFECRLDTVTWTSCSSPKDYSALANASHTFDVRATDATGNTDASPATRTWTVAVPPPDTTAPDTNITGGPSGTATTGDSSFTFNASEAGTTFECRLDAGTWGGCASPKTYLGLADGPHTFRVRATDAASNTDASPATRAWTVAVPAQPNAPTASFTWSPQNPQGPPATVTFTSTGTCAATPCTYQWRHGPPGNEVIGIGQSASWTYQSSGSKTVVLRVTDSLGRFAEASNTFTVSASTPPPPPTDADGDGVPDSSDQCPNTPAGTQVDSVGCPVTQPPPPPSGAFPDASNTGVPAGTVLTAYTGPSTISTPGTVIDGKTMGCVRVTAPGVIIRKSKISCNSGYAVLSGDGDYTGTPLTVEDSEVDCKNLGGNGFGEANIVVRRVNVHGCENGLDINQNITVEESYIHDLYNQGSAHTDGAQLASGHYESGVLKPAARNVTFLHNTIYGMGFDGSFGTSAIISNSGGDQNVLIQNNLLAGGAVAIYCEQHAKGTNYRVLDNHFSSKFGPKVGFYGVSTECSDETQSGNVYHETGQPVTLP
jgi:hypothetical protein